MKLHSSTKADVKSKETSVLLPNEDLAIKLLALLRKALSEVPDLSGGSLENSSKALKEFDVLFPKS